MDISDVVGPKRKKMIFAIGTTFQKNLVICESLSKHVLQGGMIFKKILLFFIRLDCTFLFSHTNTGGWAYSCGQIAKGYGSLKTLAQLSMHKLERARSRTYTRLSR